MNANERLLAAQQRARQRDLAMPVAEPINLALIEKEEEKASRSGLKIIRQPKVNRTPFVQIIHFNIYKLTKENYISRTEKASIMDLIVCVDRNSNTLMKVTQSNDGSTYQLLPEFLTVTDAAPIMGLAIRQTSEIISSLLEKGILFEVVNPRTVKRHGRVATARPLIINPEIVCACNRNRINATLCQLTIVNDTIEKNVKLPYKIFRRDGAVFGSLVSRHQWNALRRAAKK